MNALFAVIDSKVNVLFIAQPHAAMAVFDSEPIAQAFIEGYEDKATAKFMKIVACTITLNGMRPKRIIGQPVNEIPRRGRYKEIWGAVMALPSNEWLPVECVTVYAAKQLYIAAQTHRTLNLRASRQGITVYIQKKQAASEAFRLVNEEKDSQGVALEKESQLPGLDAFARAIIKRISDAAIELAVMRHSLCIQDEGSEPSREEMEAIKDDTIDCLTGDETGCNDPADLNETNCELVWLKSRLTQDTATASAQ